MECTELKRIIRAPTDLDQPRLEVVVDDNVVAEQLKAAAVVGDVGGDREERERATTSAGRITTTNADTTSQPRPRSTSGGARIRST